MACILLVKRDHDESFKVLLFRHGHVDTIRTDWFSWGVAVAAFEDENERSVAFGKNSSKEDRFAVLRRAAVRECILSVGGGTIPGTVKRNVTLPGINKLNIRPSALKQVAVPPGLLDAASDPGLTSGMTVDVVTHGHMKKLSLYIYLMEPERDGPFVDSWQPQAINDFRHNIDEMYAHAKYGFVWADLSYALSNPQSPVRHSSQPMMSSLRDVFATRGDEIMNRVAIMASSRTSVPPPALVRGRSTDPSVAPMHLSARNDPTSRQQQQQYQGERGTVASTDLRSGGVTSFVPAGSHESHTASPAYHQRNDVGLTREPASVSVGHIVSPNHYPHVAAVPATSDGLVYDSRLPAGHSEPARGSVPSTASQIVKVSPAPPAPPSSRAADDRTDIKGVHAISTDHDYSTHTQTQVERFFLSAGVSDEVAVTFLMRSELHKRVLRTTIANCRNEEEFQRLYMKLVRNGRPQFVTFLRVQSHIFRALRESSV